MPVLNTIGSLSTHSLGGFTVSRRPGTFFISPAFSGKNIWNLTSDGNLSLPSYGIWTITPIVNFTANVKMWGAGGGAAGGNGGAGGYAQGQLYFYSNSSYQLTVGMLGSGTTASRSAGAGGGSTGIKIVSGSVPILITGGGGGGGLINSISGSRGGGGGGLTGGDGGATYDGKGGTQSAAGAGGTGRVVAYNGSPGVAGAGGWGFPGAGSGSNNPNSGKGYTQGGNGGDGTPYLDAGGAGGGGGYYGGGGGGSGTAPQGGGGGGGGSGYAHPTYTNNIAFVVSTSYQAHPTTDTQRGTSGDGGQSSGGQGVDGKIHLAP